MMNFRHLFWKYQGLVVLAILFLASSLSTSAFLDPTNQANIVLQISENGILAVGMTYVILTGGIDLSVASVLAFASVLTATLLMRHHAGTSAAAFVAVAASAGLGLCNGVTITLGRIQPFVVTLAMMSVARGLAFLTDRTTIVVNYGESGAPVSFQWIGKYLAGIVPVPGIVLLAILCVSAVVLGSTKFGRSLYAIGGNEETARLSGISVSACKVGAYSICGALAGMAGVIHTSQLGIGKASEAGGYELNAIASVVIGGASLMGGVGTVWGTFVGALIIGILDNILGLHNVDSYWQMVIKGSIIVAAVLLQRVQTTR